MQRCMRAVNSMPMIHMAYVLSCLCRLKQAGLSVIPEFDHAVHVLHVPV